MQNVFISSFSINILFFFISFFIKVLLFLDCKNKSCKKLLFYQFLICLFLWILAQHNYWLNYCYGNRAIVFKKILIYFLNDERWLKDSFSLSINCFFNQFVLIIVFVFLLLYLGLYWKFKTFLKEVNNNRFC